MATTLFGLGGRTALTATATVAFLAWAVWNYGLRKSPLPGQPLSPPAWSVVLLDIGSLEEGAAGSLERMAHLLSDRLRTKVWPASVLKRARHPLENVVQKIMGGSKQARFCVVPYFLGPSQSLSTLGDRLTQATGITVDTAPNASLPVDGSPRILLRVAAPLYAPGDNRIARVIADRVEDTVQKHRLANPTVALVDHGTPTLEVHLVRDAVEAQLKALIPHPVQACCMERRPDPEFDFNNPMLEKLLGTPGFDHGDVVVALLFLSPGKHAGPGGDIDGIRKEAETNHPTLKTSKTDVLSGHPLMLDILHDRFTGLSLPK
jgi:sirohydrochlorin ferrochelatase